jgi:hypothetical protein
MKGIFLLLCLVAGCANASERLVWSDAAGVQYVLTQKRIPFYCIGSHEMYTIDQNGNSRSGCWINSFDFVYVYFNDTKDIEDPLVFNLTKFKRQAISAGQLTQSPNKTISFPK